jgi:hypothetical protein
MQFLRGQDDVGVGSKMLRREHNEVEPLLRMKNTGPAFSLRHHRVLAAQQPRKRGHTEVKEGRGLTHRLFSGRTRTATLTAQPSAMVFCGSSSYSIHHGEK